MGNEKSEKIKSIVLRIFLLIGCSIYFYPIISDYVNDLNQSSAIVRYRDAVSQFDEDEVKIIKSQADDYNRKLALVNYPFHEPDQVEGYRDLLNPFHNGMMGYIIIKKINVNLPIFHGLNEGVIQKGVGHLPGSSLPVGGETTHVVISTHSGLASAKLFTDLNQLEIGDEFTLSILDQNLTYRIDQILTVLPHEVEALKIEEGKDYVTMFTCTPYGINTHRLFVRGERVFKQTMDKQEKVEIKEVVEDKIKTTALQMLAIIGVFAIILITIIKDVVLLLVKRRPHDDSDG